MCIVTFGIAAEVATKNVGCTEVSDLTKNVGCTEVSDLTKCRRRKFPSYSREKSQKEERLFLLWTKNGPVYSLR
jgi:hypothetical protein